MKISDIKIASYCVGKRLLGYQLLRNPKGTSNTTVTMIKKNSGITFDLDKFCSYKRVTRDFSKQPNKTIKEELHSYIRPFYDKDCKKIDEKKEMDYYKSFSDKNKKPIYKDKGDVDYETLYNRDFSGINKEKYCGKSVAVDPFYACIGPVPLEVNNYESFADKETQKFFNKKRTEKHFKTPGFISTLISNLKNR